MKSSNRMDWTLVVLGVVGLMVVLFMGWGCYQVLKRHVHLPEPRTDHITSMWESHQVRSWPDTTEVVDLYVLRLGYYWSDVDSTVYRRLRVGDTLTVFSRYDSLRSRGQYIGTLWRMTYPARIEGISN